MEYMSADNTGISIFFVFILFEFIIILGHVHIMTGPAKNEDGKIEIVLESEFVDGHPLPKKPKMLKVGFIKYVIQHCFIL